MKNLIDQEDTILAKDTNIPNDVDEEIIDPEDMFVTLDMEDGTQEECQVMFIFEVDGQDYICLIPVDSDTEVFIYRYFEDEDGTPSLGNIESDDEWEKVSDRYEEILDEEEFENM